MGMEIIESKVICKQPGRYIGWPTIGKTETGRLLVVFSGDRDLHMCPFGKTQLVTSDDGGKTWSEPVTINNTPLDDRDAGICITPSDTIVVSWFTSVDFEKLAQDHPENAWKERIAKITDEDRKRWLGAWTRRSTDGGNTWEEAVASLVDTPHGPVVLADGRLLFVGTRFAGKDAFGRIAAVESRDEGRSWKEIGLMPVPSGEEPERLCEPHIAETEPGHLTALMRYEPADHNPEANSCVLWQSESHDGGKTWTEPHPTPIWGYPPHLIRLRDGRLLVTYGYRRKPYGQRACFSSDGGRTWEFEEEVILRKDAPNSDLGYPASVELENGEIITVYYQIDLPGEKTCLMMTRWHP